MVSKAGHLRQQANVLRGIRSTAMTKVVPDVPVKVISLGTLGKGALMSFSKSTSSSST